MCFALLHAQVTLLGNEVGLEFAAGYSGSITETDGTSKTTTETSTMTTHLETIVKSGCNISSSGWAKTNTVQWKQDYGG